MAVSGIELLPLLEKSLNNSRKGGEAMCTADSFVEQQCPFGLMSSGSFKPVGDRFNPIWAWLCCWLFGKTPSMQLKVKIQKKKKSLN